jgi:hypothetical protein
MTESDPKTDRQQGAPEGRRPWVTPRVIVSELASLTQAVPFTTPGHTDRHGLGTTAFDS